MDILLTSPLPLTDPGYRAHRGAAVSPTDQVHVVDEHRDDRDALSALLADRGYATCIWPSIAEFLDAMPDTAAGCVVIDWCHPVVREHGLRPRLLDLPRHHSTVVLTRSCDMIAAIGAMKAGVLDVLEKPVDPPALFAAIDEAVVHGHRRRHHAAADLDARRRIAALSGREREVLVGLMAGGTNKSLARDMAISARTVEIHRARMMAKLSAASLAHAIRVALSGGL